jgi:hypothetical protein
MQMTVRPMASIGIDAGKAAHHAAAVDELDRLYWSRPASPWQSNSSQVGTTRNILRSSATIRSRRS